MKIKKHINKKVALQSMAKDPPSEYQLQKKKNKGELIIYKNADNQTQVEVKFEEETVWLTQQQIADVFVTQRPAITKQLNNNFKSGELKKKVVSSILEHTTKHGAIQGKMQLTKSKYYNLDAIIYDC